MNQNPWTPFPWVHQFPSLMTQEGRRWLPSCGAHHASWPFGSLETSHNPVNVSRPFTINVSKPI